MSDLRPTSVQVRTIGEYTWIHADYPDALAERWDELGMPAFAVDLARTAHHRPRVAWVEDHLLLVCKPAAYVDPVEVVAVGEFVVLAGPDTVVTIGRGFGAELSRAQRALEQDPARLALGPAALVHALVNEFVDGYALVVDGVDNDVDEIETEVFSAERGSHAERIYRLKSEVQQFRRAVGPLPDELERLLATGLPEPFAALAAHFGDVRTKAARTSEHVRHLDELLNAALHAHQAQVQIQQNNDMRRISAWVAIVAAPTAMASLYGMNFRHMPELEWRFGYLLVVLVMASACTVLYGLFKRSGWL
jgi:magnesium transporter